MIVQEVYRHPDRALAKFDFVQDGKETLAWLLFLWRWHKDKKARRAYEKMAKKMAALEKKKAQDIKDELGRQAALRILNRLERERACS